MHAIVERDERMKGLRKPPRRTGQTITERDEEGGEKIEKHVWNVY
jgi:hypothetical protein